MMLSPFVFEEGKTIKNFAGVDCFDEPSPCVLEQLSQCVIQLSNDQSKYVPWLVCMDTDGESKADAQKCAEQVGVDYSAVSQCQQTQGTQILQKLVKQDASVNSTPTVKVNGKTVGGKQGPDFANVKQALCAADPSLKGCSSTVSNEAALVV
jgi:hypothetical protein